MSKRHSIAIVLSGATVTDQLPQEWNDWYSRKGHRPACSRAISEFELFGDFLAFSFKFWTFARSNRRTVKSSRRRGGTNRRRPLESGPSTAESAGTSAAGPHEGSRDASRNFIQGNEVRRMTTSGAPD